MRKEYEKMSKKYEISLKNGAFRKHRLLFLSLPESLFCAPEISTDAALRYLKHNRKIYDSWLLSLLAYNLGEKAVTRAIEKLGTRDPWKLIRGGIENDPDYLPRIMATVIVLKNPALLD